jgi:undecaprenyl-diphosphatase
LKSKLTRLVQLIRSFLQQHFRSENPDLPYYITMGIALVLFVVGLNGFIELTDELAENELTKYDQAAHNFALSLRTPGATQFFTIITHLGDRFAYIGFIVAFALFSYLKKRTWKSVVQPVLVLLLSQLSNMVLKRVINRSRPALEHLVSVNTLSYPSGHSMAAMAFYGFFVYLCLQSDLSRLWKWITVTMLVSLIILVGLSRIYLGVHFASDVLAGFIGGFIWVTFCVVVFNIIDMIRRRRASSLSSGS